MYFNPAQYPYSVKRPDLGFTGTGAIEELPIIIIITYIQVRMLYKSIQHGFSSDKKGEYLKKQLLNYLKFDTRLKIKF